MNSVIIPVAFLLAILLFPAAHPDQVLAQDLGGDPKVLTSRVETNQVDRQGDYYSIYSYIKLKYKKISDDDAKEIAKCLVDSGETFSIDPKFVAALIERESAFKKDAVSSTGARGLGQIKDFNFKTLKIDNPEDIRQNVNGTAAHIKSMLSSWSDRSEKVSLALASYFRGYTAIKNQGQFDTKTAQYVGDIIKNYDYISAYKAQLPQVEPAPSSLVATSNASVIN